MVEKLNMTFTADYQLDAVGLYCPEPVMMLHNRVRDIEAGQVLQVTASDPSTTRDIPKFCTFLGHELLHHGKEGENFVYFIKKGV